MNRFPPISIFMLMVALLAPCLAESGRKPNVLFIIADDASRHFGEAYACGWVRTPNIDRLAKQGLVFDNAYTPTSKCSPSRASILTGRNPWQLEEAANHWPVFPARFVAFSEALAKSGVHCGGAGKTWGPGEAMTADGKPRDFALGGKAQKGAKDPGTGLTNFLKDRAPDKPFFYWFGSHHPHRPYQLDPVVEAGRKPAEIDHVPAYLPDDEVVRRDLLAYGKEVEAFDAQVGSLVAALEASGEADHTLVIITSDNGMPFPRVKGHTFDDAHRLPLVARWPEEIKRPGRRVADLVSFIDFAPTFLELFGVDGNACGMSAVTGTSFLDLLRGEKKTAREFVIIGRERNDMLARPGSPSGLGYPVRAIRQGDFLFVHNFAPDRWPCGDPGLGLKDTDNGPTKELIAKSGEGSSFWQLAFGKRPAEQFFDLTNDSDCMKDLVGDPAYGARIETMRERLTDELKKQSDPRVLGKGDVFDQYRSPRQSPKPKEP